MKLHKHTPWQTKGVRAWLASVALVQSLNLTKQIVNKTNSGFATHISQYVHSMWSPGGGSYDEKETCSSQNLPKRRVSTYLWNLIQGWALEKTWSSPRIQTRVVTHLALTGTCMCCSVPDYYGQYFSSNPEAFLRDRRTVGLVLTPSHSPVCWKFPVSRPFLIILFRGQKWLFKFKVSTLLYIGPTKLLNHGNLNYCKYIHVAQGLENSRVLFPGGNPVFLIKNRSIGNQQLA